VSEQPTADQRATESLTSNEHLPRLLREAERRVNAHVFNGAGDSHLASIPANYDTDTDLLLIRAADEIERLQREVERLDGDCCLLKCERDMFKKQRADWKAVYEGEIARRAVPPTERRFAVGDEVTIAHWGDTSKIVSITCRLEDGSTVDLESGCVAVTKSPSLSDHCPCGAISPAPGYACDRCSREAVETSLTHHTTWAAGENGLCKHCGLSWYLHIAEDGQGRKDVCTSLRATVSEKGDL
jgi:hypothetical protein